MSFNLGIKRRGFCFRCFSKDAVKQAALSLQVPAAGRGAVTASWSRGLLVQVPTGYALGPTALRPPPFQVWLFRQKPESLNPLTKYLSATTGFGSNYVTTEKVGCPLSRGGSGRSLWPPQSSMSGECPPVPRMFVSFPPPFPVPFQMDLDDDTAEKFYRSLLELERHLRATLLSTD